MRQKVQKVLSFIQYVPKRTAFFSLLALGVLLPAASFAWGPSRDTYTSAHPANHVVFNSITDNPVQGDERDFMQIREASADNNAYTNSISLKPDTEYVVYIYYHNNAASNLNASGKGKATGAYVKATLPTYVNNGQTHVNGEGFVGATNAKPKQVFDEVFFDNKSGQKLNISYVKGSATIHNLGKTDGETLADTIVTSGAPIGYDHLDGVVPGCNDYAGYVTLRVKTSGKKATPVTPVSTLKTDYRLGKKVSKHGTYNWTAKYTAQPGETVDFLVLYTNKGTSTLKNVTLKDQLPTGLTYVSGSGKLYDPAHQSGVLDNLLTTTGTVIETTKPNESAMEIFSAKVASTSKFTCGTTVLTNTATVTTNVGSKSDTAEVDVTKKCDTTPTTTKPVTPVKPETPTTPEQPAKPKTPSNPTTVTTTTTQPEQTTSTPEETTAQSPAQTDIQPVAAVTPDSTPANNPAPLPSTGPTEIVGSIVGTSSLGLGVHHYLASRRALRKSQL